MARTPTRLKLLLLSWAIPPTANGSAVLIGNLARQFTQDEMIILGAWFQGSPSLVNWEATLPHLHHITWQPSDKVKNYDRRWRWLQFPWLVVRALWTALRCDAILVIYPDETFLLAGYLVSRITGKPLYAYFHNTYVEAYGSKLDPNKRFPRWLQGNVFKHARHIFTMSEGMQRYYQQTYPDVPFSPLLHTFNEPLPEHQPGIKPLNKPLKLILSGGINHSNKGAAAMFAAAVRDLPDTHLAVFTLTSRETLQQLGFFHERISIGELPRQELLTHLTHSDILLLPHGFSDDLGEEETKTIFPTRTIEYLIAGKPILAHLPADCFLADFLRKYDCALLVTEPSLEAVKQAILQLQQDTTLQQRLVSNAYKAARLFHAPHVAQHLRDVINTTLKNP